MNRTLKMLLLTTFIFYLATGLFGPIYAVFVEDIGGDLLTAGTAYAAYSVAAGLLIYLIGRWEDRSKHQEKFIAISMALGSVGFLGYMLITSPLGLLAVQALFGVQFAILAPAFDSLYSRSLDRGRYASEWGLSEASDHIVVGMAALIGGAIAELYGFQALFAVMLGISLVATVLALLMLSEGRKA
jgi:MFS family permease